MRIGLDVDGVFADFVLGFTKVLNEITDSEFMPYSTDEQKEWRFDVSSSTYDFAWDVIGQRMNWWMTLEPLISDMDKVAVNYLIHNNDVYFITSRKSLKRGLSAQMQTEYWLEGIGIDTAHATVLTTQASKKHKLLDALDIIFYIDDKPSILDSLMKETSPVGSLTVCARNWEYNKDCIVDARFNSVEAYAEWIMKNFSE